MNYIFFFIAVLVLAVPAAYAEVEQGINFDKEILQTNNDGSQKIKISSIPYNRIHNGTNWVDFIADGTSIQTHGGTVTLNENGEFVWGTKFTDKIIGKYADISDLNTWTYPNTLNNDTPDVSWNGTVLTSSKLKSGVGQMDYKYVFYEDNWKTLLEVKNLSSLTTKVFGFDQIVDLNSDTIRFGNVTRNLDNFNGTVFLKPWLDANQGKVLDLLNGVHFDFDLGYENLHSITVIDTGVGKSRLIFDYRTSEVLLPGETLIIDPTFGPASTSASGRVASNNPSSGSCVGRTYTTSDAALDINYGAGGFCSIPWMKFDVTTIPDDAIVSSVTIVYDVDVETNTANDCVLRELDTEPAAGQTTYNESLSGTKITAANSDCRTVANDYEFNFNAAGISDLEAKLAAAQNWYAFSYFFDTATAPDGETTDSLNWEMTVVYTSTPPPDSITDLTADSVGTTTAILSFTPPNLNGESLINYMLNVTTPQQDTPPSTFWMNGSSSPFNVVGLTASTAYSASASAFTAGGGNWTLANVLNFTTTSVNSPAAVNSLTGTSNIGLSLITLSWSAPAEGGAPITGYMVNYTTPVGSPETKIENNTGTTDTTYNVLNLIIGTEYSFRVCAWNTYGCGAGGNIWNGTIETNYVIGNFSSPDVENTNDFSIFYDRTDVNATTINLEVLYPNSYDLECNMYYAFARTNNTYGNLTSTPSGDDLVSVFQFVNATGDIITVNCYDTITGDSSKYVITLTEFPFKEQLDNLRNGTYGTYFQIGAIDGVLFMIIIVGMIGLNRTTPIAGVIFVIITTVGLSVMGLITYPVIMYPALALVAVWGFMSTRKDD